MKKAFTLIELLVVVLIIGILAAVALPQYQKAVDKARMTQLITFASAVAQAQHRYYLANGSYTTKWEDLDIGLAGYTASGYYLSGPHLSATLSTTNGNMYFRNNTDLPGILLIVPKNGKSRSCHADKTNERAQALCKSVCGQATLGTDGNWKSCSF